MKPRDYKPIEFRQLCAVVKMLLQQAPQIDDAEWKARAKDRLEELGFAEPDAETLSRAMTQVEYALKQTIGERIRREVPVPSKPNQDHQPAPPVSSVRTNHPAGWEIVVAMMRRLRKVSPVSAATLQSAPRREVLGITEPVALQEFWKQVGDGEDRLSLLRAFAEVAIVRPDGWNYDEVRAEFQALRFGQENCFVCYYSEVQYHHVIQIQHGGSNHRRNFVAICERCHAAIHPWMGIHPTRARGWTRVGSIDPVKAMQKVRESA